MQHLDLGLFRYQIEYTYGNDKEVENFVSNNNLAILYEKWNEFSESDLLKFKVSN